MNYRSGVKSLFLSLSLLLFVSCYRAQNTQIFYTPPTFDILAKENRSSYYDYGGVNIKNEVPFFSTRDSVTMTLSMWFSLTSGNPKNYPVTCFLTGLPPGATGANDSFNFKLSFGVWYNVFINLDTGIYPFNINVRTSTYGLQTYPAILHVSPK